jgi:hypothetical protein
MRNIHFAAAALTAPAVAATPSTSHVEQPSSLELGTSHLELPAARLRTRRVSVSPIEEYHLRPGKVRPIPDAFAAIILSFNGRAEVTAKGVTIDRKELGGRITFHHEASLVCNDLSCREKKWFYVLNRMKPDRLHLLGEDGTYIETLPRITMPAVLDNAAQAAVAAAHKRQIRLVATRLQDLQSEETEAAIDHLRHNAETMTRYVQTFDAPAPASSPSTINSQPSTPPEGGNLSRIVAHDRAHKQALARNASAATLGKALNASRTSNHQPSTPDHPLPPEDWSHHPRNLNAQAPEETTPVEAW